MFYVYCPLICFYYRRYYFSWIACALYDQRIIMSSAIASCERYDADELPLAYNNDLRRHLPPIASISAIVYGFACSAVSCFTCAIRCSASQRLLVVDKLYPRRVFHTFCNATVLISYPSVC